MPPEIDVETYATIAAHLAEEGADRDAILAEHGLDETSWTALEDHWQSRLSDAIDADVETEGVPAILGAYSHAFARAQRESGILSLEAFANATRALAGSRDIPATLAQHGMSLQQFLRANEHWTHRMIADPSLAETFRKLLG